MNKQQVEKARFVLQSSLVTFAILALISGCTRGMNRAAISPGSGPLSAAEINAVEKLAATDSQVRIIKISGAGALQTFTMPARDVERFQNEALRSDPAGGIYLDGDVTTSSGDGALEPSEQLLFGGKEEFGIDEWNTKYPNADGRGIKVSIVDDGVAQARPGLTVTSTGLPKIVGIRSQSPEHSLVLRIAGSSCRKDEKDIIDSVATWTIESKSTPLLETADFIQPFALSGCGISTDMRWKSINCSSLVNFVGTTGMTLGDEGRYPALAIMKDGNVFVMVDFDLDSIITDDEVMTPVSQNGGKAKMFSTGEAISVDFSRSNQWAALPGGTDNPLDPNLKCNPMEELGILTIKYPETAGGTGGHGEGVASISTGYKIGGKNFDGVAPGAQIIDVQLGVARSYTISEIARALKTGGMNGRVVNLSYSLFFSSIESQIAMGRAMAKILDSTDALYFFSAGNNGPGRSSMNRGLLYPDFAVVVGAFLNGRMAQSTFGSAAPIEGVVTYSSRGPGLDGATHSLVISPLAGLYVGPADRGLPPFSGTSSATPAMSGFAARVLSQIQIDGLPWDRKAFRQALIDGARPLPNVAFVDQGYGLPNLTRTYERYQAILSQTKSIPTVGVGSIQPKGAGTGTALNPYGVARKGILVRGDWDRYDEYNIALGLGFGSDWSAIEARNYSERIRIETKAPWISKMQDMMLSIAGVTFAVAIDYSQIATPGEYLDEVRVVRASDGKLLQVIPVSIFVPMKDLNGVHAFQSKVPARDLARVFVQKPDWAEFAVIRRKAPLGERLCGRFGIYAPNGIRMTALGTRAGTMVEETSFATAFDGVYEVIPEGRGNHTTCPKDQVMDFEIQWVGLGFTTNSVALSGKDLLLTLQSNTRAPIQSGSLTFGSPMFEYGLSLTAAASGAFEWQNEKVDFSKAKSVQFALDETLAKKLRAQGAYLYLEYILTALDQKSAPQTLAGGTVHMESAWVSAGKIESTTWPARLSVTAFDWNPNASAGSMGFPKNLNLRVREERSEYAGMKTDIPVFEAFGSQPVTFQTKVKNWGSLSTENMDMSCLFTPVGYSLAVPCGSLSLE